MNNESIKNGDYQRESSQIAAKPQKSSKMFILATILITSAITIPASITLSAFFINQNKNGTNTNTSSFSSSSDTTVAPAVPVEKPAEEPIPSPKNTNSQFSNPIITGTTITFSSSTEPNQSNEPHYLNITVKDGEIVSCTINKQTNNGGGTSVGECQITGITGKIYKIANLGKGQMAYHDKVAFILEDGSVDYLPLENAILNNNFQIAGKLGVDRQVVDIIPVLGSNYGTYAIVFSDGSYIEYDDSLLK